MRNLIHAALIGASITMFTACSSTAQVATSKVNVVATENVDNATEQSLTYSLPKTVIKVEIQTEKIIKKAGPFYRYSQRFLNLKDVITEDTEEWVIKGVKLYTIGVADDSKRYNIYTEGVSSATNINLTPEGVLRGFNNPEEYTYTTTKTCKTIVPTLEDMNFDNVPLSEDILLKTSSAAMAQETANMIYTIRANRFDMLSGEIENTPADGKSYQLMLDRFDQLEADYLTLFAGKEEHISKTVVLDFIPSTSSDETNVLCRFSSLNGIVDAMDLSGTPIYLKINVDDFYRLPDQQKEPQKGETPRNGIYYCIPANATVSIIDKNVELLSQPIKLAQFGQVVSMPSSILEKENAVVKICPATGALIEVK